MSRLKAVVVAVAALSIFIAAPAKAEGPHAGCRTGRFIGSYTLAQPLQDVFGDGSVLHTWVLQLDLHGDGTAGQYWTGLPDYMINFGTGSPSIGAWGCRKDGKLVVTFIDAVYLPTTPDANAPNPDIALASHRRSTYLFSVEDDDTLKLLEHRNRIYGATDDPTDPAGGVLRPLDTTTAEYKRLAASDADLVAP